MEVGKGRSGVYDLWLMTQRWLDENAGAEQAILEAMGGALKKMRETLSLYEQKAMMWEALRSLRRSYVPPCTAAIEMEKLPGYHNGVVGTKQGE